MHIMSAMRSARLAVVPLWVMAATFLLPAYRACGTTYTPAEYAAGSAFGFAWVTPPYLFALAFAVMTTLALKRGAVSQQLRRLGLGAVAAFGAFALTLGAVWTISEPNEWPWLTATAAGVAGSAFVIRQARGKEPWRIWQHLVGAFALLAAAAGPSIMFAGEAWSWVFRDDPARVSSLYLGAWLYLTSLAVLLVQCVVTVFRRARQ